MIILKIRGIVVEAETGIGLSGLFVKAYDKDLLFDDLLGTTYTHKNGRFEIVSELEDFRDFFDVKPDIYLKIYTPDAEKVLYSTEDAVRWQAGRVEEFEVRIPHEVLGDLALGCTVRLQDEGGGERTDFDVGESLIVRVEGIPPETLYDFVIQDDEGNEIFTSRVRSDLYGVIEGATIWPQMGLEDVQTWEPLSVEQAQERWRGRKARLEIRMEGKVLSNQAIRFPDAFIRPLLLSTDADGVVVNGFEAGKREAIISGHNLPFRGRVRLYMVPRQYDWHPGNEFSPVMLAGERPAHVDVDVAEEGHFRARIARPRELEPGSYDFIARQLRYGYEDDEDFFLRRTDVVTRRVAGLVVREEFMASKAVLGGCANAQKEMAGRKISGKPYFQFAETFQVGEDIYAALDPAALDPNLIGKKVAFYVVEHKSAAAWSADNSLTHLPVLGGNSAVQEFINMSGCINYNEHRLWQNAQQVGEYDIVADFGNNAANPANFLRDNSFDQPSDIIDGYFVPGFRVVKDPTTDTSFPYYGSYSYTESTVIGSVPLGSKTVTNDFGQSVTVPLRAEVRFPADQPNKTDPADISSQETNYPLVVIVHGQGHDYQGYDYLLNHWARNGFIAASIHLVNAGGVQKGTDRALIMFEHLDILKTLFGSKAANNVGIMGHSRGGEGVAIAPRVNQQTPSLTHNINAVISLAPTTQYTNETIEGAWATPYLVVYGSMDGDVAGGYGKPWNTGFALYDRAKDEKKSMVFVYGATHNRFIETNSDSDIYLGKLTTTDHSTFVNKDAHQKIAKAYMAAFFRWHLKGESYWQSIFRGEWVPAAVATADSGKVKLYTQYEDTIREVVDDFEGPHTATSWETSSMKVGTTSATVEDDDSLPVDPEEKELYDMDTHSPHDTSGLLLRWDGLSDKLRFQILPAYENVEAYNAISFRVTQKAYSSENTPGQIQDLYVTLTDSSTPNPKSRSVKVSKFAEIPPPHLRSISQYTKSAMCIVRIPLHVFKIAVLGADEVDLKKVQSVTFDFKVTSKPKGEIEIDSVEFTK